MSSKRIIWFHRSRSIGWAVFGIVSFIMGWYENIMLVWIASLYANIVSDWGAAEAADDRMLAKRMDRLEELVRHERD